MVHLEQMLPCWWGGRGASLSSRRGFFRVKKGITWRLLKSNKGDGSTTKWGKITYHILSYLITSHHILSYLSFSGGSFPDASTMADQKTLWQDGLQSPWWRCRRDKGKATTLFLTGPSSRDFWHMFFLLHRVIPYPFCPCYPFAKQTWSWKISRFIYSVFWSWQHMTILIFHREVP